MPASPAESDPQRTQNVDTTPLGKLQDLAISHLTVTIPSTVIDPDAPMVALPVRAFQELLTRGQVGQEAKDRAWRYLGERARAERGEWNLFALVAASPGLRKTAKKLARGSSKPQTQRAHYKIAVEFLFALHRLDLSEEWVFNRLVGAAYDQASGRKRKKRPSTLEAASADQITAPPDADPAFQAEINENNQTRVTAMLHRVIAQVNAAPGRERITPVQAALIGRTYLGGEPLKQVAADLKLSVPSASKQRKRAATLIAQFLGQPQLAGPPPPEDARTSPTAPPPEGPPTDAPATPPPAAG